MVTHEIGDQRLNVFLALAKRWNMERNHVKAIIEVFAELALLHGLFEVAVRGGNNANVNRNRHPPANRVDRSLLENTQETHLHIERHFSNLVEEDGSAMRELELSDLLRERAGERAFLMAEQLAFDQGLGDRAAVDGHKRLSLTRGTVVDGSRDDFFARTGFAAHERRGATVLDSQNLLRYFGEGFRAAGDEPGVADDLGAGRSVGLEGHHARYLVKLAAVAPDGCDLVLRWEILVDEIHRASLERIDRGGSRGVARENHDVEPAVDGEKVFCGLVACSAR